MKSISSNNLSMQLYLHQYLTSTPLTSTNKSLFIHKYKQIASNSNNSRSLMLVAWFRIFLKYMNNSILKYLNIAIIWPLNNRTWILSISKSNHRPWWTLIRKQQSSNNNSNNYLTTKISSLKRSLRIHTFQQATSTNNEGLQINNSPIKKT